MKGGGREVVRAGGQGGVAAPCTHLRTDLLGDSMMVIQTRLRKTVQSVLSRPCDTTTVSFTQHDHVTKLARGIFCFVGEDAAIAGEDTEHVSAISIRSVHLMFHIIYVILIYAAEPIRSERGQQHDNSKALTSTSHSSLHFDEPSSHAMQAELITC